MTGIKCHHFKDPPGFINTMKEDTHPHQDGAMSPLDDFTSPFHKQHLTAPLPHQGGVMSPLDDFTFPFHKQHLTAPLHDPVEDEIEPATHAMNYYLIVAFHADVDMRPCNPVLRVVHLAKHADTLQHQLIHNPTGVAMLTTCQLCDACINTKQEFSIDTYKLLSITALSITDGEAYTLTNNVADMNMHVSKNQTVLTHRSNIGLVPRFLHRSVQIGVRSLMQARSTSSVTDVQLCIILIRESLSSARSISVQLRALHPYLSTPENFYDALAIFSRSLHVPSFKSGAFRFALLDV